MSSPTLASTFPGGATATVAYLLSRANLSAPARTEVGHLANMVIG